MRTHSLNTHTFTRVRTHTRSHLLTFARAVTSPSLDSTLYLPVSSWCVAAAFTLGPRLFLQRTESGPVNALMADQAKAALQDLVPPPPADWGYPSPRGRARPPALRLSSCLSGARSIRRLNVQPLFFDASMFDTFCLCLPQMLETLCPTSLHPTSHTATLPHTPPHTHHNQTPHTHTHTPTFKDASAAA